MKTPDEEIQSAVFAIRCKSKSGERLGPKEQKFVEKIFNDFPEWYRSLDKEVFEATKPFGSC